MAYNVCGKEVEMVGDDFMVGKPIINVHASWSAWSEMTANLRGEGLLPIVASRPGERMLATRELRKCQKFIKCATKLE